MNKAKQVAALAALVLGAGSASAADYVLQVVGVGGEVSTGTIEVQSYSWGMHKAGGSAQGQARLGGGGKASMSDLSVAAEGVRAPRDAATGQASGRRSVAVGDVDGDGQADAVAQPKVGDVAVLGVVTRGADKGCVKGARFSSVVLTGPGQRIEMQDAEVISCGSADGAGKKEFKGHVTLLK